jgi:hypothetical protein
LVFNIKTGAVFVDLTAACIAWREGLDDKISGSCSLPKAIQFAEQHIVESLLPGFFFGDQSSRYGNV